jgi:SPP1 gp7 family putative phage head morphogenesis protein
MSGPTGPDYGGLLDILAHDRPGPTIAQREGAWAFVPDDAFEAMSERLGMAGNGTPLAALLDAFGEEAASNASAALMAAIAAGSNPLVIAQMLQQALGESESRAQTIARTELLGAYRDAQLANYRANADVIRGWMWSSSGGAGTCAACMFMDGTVHGLDEMMDTHVCCKCSAIPVTNSWDDLLGAYGIDGSDIPDTAIDVGYEPMMDWFNHQATNAERLDILGPSKLEAWLRGDITIQDLVGWRDDPEWGVSIYEKSLRELGLDAQDYLASMRVPADADVVPYRFNPETRRYERIAEKAPPLPVDVDLVPYRLDLNTGRWERIPEEDLPAKVPMPGESPSQVVTRSGTYPDGRQWEVRDFKGPTPPSETKVGAFDSLGSNAGEHWTPKWEYSPGETRNEWVDAADRWSVGPVNQQCVNCDRIFGGPLDGEFPDHMVFGSHGICSECYADQVRRDTLRDYFARDESRTAADIERMVQDYLAKTPEPLAQTTLEARAEAQAARDVGERERFSRLPGAQEALPEPKRWPTQQDVEKADASGKQWKPVQNGGTRPAFEWKVNGERFFVKQGEYHGSTTAYAVGQADGAARFLVPVRGFNANGYGWEVQSWIEGKSLGELSEKEMQAALARLSESDRWELALHDYVVDNYDMHAANYLVDRAGAIRRLDEADAFAGSGRAKQDTWLRQFAKQLDAPNAVAKDWTPILTSMTSDTRIPRDVLDSIVANRQAILDAAKGSLSKWTQEEQMAALEKRLDVLAQLTKVNNPTAGDLRDLLEGKTLPTERFSRLPGIPFEAQTAADRAGVDALKSIAGRKDVTFDDLAQLAGGRGLPGERVAVQSVYNDTVHLELRGPNYRNEVTILRDAKTGRLKIEIGQMNVYEPGKGIGTDIFAQTKDAAERLDAQSIELHANGAAEGGRVLGIDNGFNTFAQYGFDGHPEPWLYDRAEHYPETRIFARQYAASLQRGKESLDPWVHDFIDLPKVTMPDGSVITGREWWARNGQGFDGVFDLTPGSYSQRTWQEYLDLRTSRIAGEAERFSALPEGTLPTEALQQRVADTLGQDTASDWADALGEHGQLHGPIAEREEVLAWEPKETSAEVSEALRDQLGTVHVNLDDFDPAIANQFAQTMRVLDADWPEVFDEQMQYIGQTGRDFSAFNPDSTLGRTRYSLASSNGPVIGFNRYFFSMARTDAEELVATLRDNVERGHFFAGAEAPASQLAHEFGHSLYWWALDHENNEIGQMVFDYLDRWRGEVPAFSAYAATDAHELFAEAFAANYFGTAEVLADPMVADMGRLLDDLKQVLAEEPLAEAAVPGVERAAALGEERFAALQPSLTREALAEKPMPELRQMARDMDVQPARTKAETIDRILAKAKDAEAAPKVAPVEPAGEPAPVFHEHVPSSDPAAVLREKVDERLAQRELLYGQQHDLLEEKTTLENAQRDTAATIERAEFQAKTDIYRATLDPTDPEVKRYFKDRAAYLKNSADQAAAKAEQDRLERVMDTLSLQGKQGGPEFAQAKADYTAAVKVEEKAHKAGQRLYSNLWEKSPGVYKPELDSIAGFESKMQRMGITFSPQDIASAPSMVAARERIAAIEPRLAELKTQLKALDQPLKTLNAEIKRALAELRDLNVALGDSFDTMRSFSGALDLPEGRQPPNALMNKLDYRMHEPRAVTKGRIIDDIAVRLKDNPAWAEYVDRVPTPDNLGIYHQYVHVTAEVRDTKSAKLVADLVRKWGVGYRPGSPSWVALQMAAREEFGLDAALHGATAAQIRAGEAAYAKDGAALRVFVRAMYDNTQKWFAEHGITEIDVYRGFSWREGDAHLPTGINWGPLANQNNGITDIELNPFQSFSADINVSQGTTNIGGVFGVGGGFAQGGDYNLLIGARVPVDRVLSTAQTGFGAKLESEIVVMGRLTDTVAYRAGTRVEEALLRQAEEQIIGGGEILYTLADGTSIHIMANADGTFTLSYLAGPQGKLGTMKVGASKTYKTLTGLNRNLKAMGLANIYT